MAASISVGQSASRETRGRAEARTESKQSKGAQREESAGGRAASPGVKGRATVGLIGRREGGVHRQAAGYLARDREEDPRRRCPSRWEIRRVPEPKATGDVPFDGWLDVCVAPSIASHITSMVLNVNAPDSGRVSLWGS